MKLPIPAGQIAIKDDGETRITGHERYLNIGPLSIRWNSLAYYPHKQINWQRVSTIDRVMSLPKDWRPHLIDYYWNNRFIMTSARRHICIRVRGVNVLFAVRPTSAIRFGAWQINGINIKQRWNLRKVWRVFRQQVNANDD
jgi:hypothetical protein